MTTASTGSWSVPVGGQQVRIDDGAQSPPAGLQLVNRGDNGGTVWIAAGPAGAAAAVPLGPGATLQWTDPGAYPYAFLSSAATLPETIVCTGQSAGYSNPTVVAASLIAQGIPSTMLDTGYGTWPALVALAAGVWNRSNSPTITANMPTCMVGQSASLLLAVSWPTSAGGNLLQLMFDDPALPSFPPQTIFLSANNAADPARAYCWQVPVLGPRVTLVNIQSAGDAANSTAYVRLVGSNRAAPKLRQVGDENGAHVVAHTGSVAGGSVTTLTGLSGAPTQTVMNGPVTLNLWGGAAAAGYIFAGWTDPVSGSSIVTTVAHVASGVSGPIQWTHPTLPVTWQYSPDTTTAASTAYLTVTGGN